MYDDEENEIEHGEHGQKPEPRKHRWEKLKDVGTVAAVVTAAVAVFQTIWMLSGR